MDTAITIPPFFKDAGRGKERFWGEENATPQPMVISCSGLDDKEKAELIPTLSTCVHLGHAFDHSKKEGAMSNKAAARHAVAQMGASIFKFKEG